MSQEIRTDRSFTLHPVQAINRIKRVKSVHLKREQFLPELMPGRFQRNLIKIPTIPSSGAEDDKARAVDLNFSEFESAKQIVKEGREAMVDGSPQNEWMNYNHARENVFLRGQANDKEFYQCYKKFDRAQQIIDELDIPANLYIKMIRISQSQNLIPKSLGIPKQCNLSFKMNARRQLLGQSQYSQVIVGVLQHSPAPELVNLADNQLSAVVIKQILDEVKEGVQVIDLSNNKIGKNLDFSLDIKSLIKLILAGTHLNDESIKVLRNRIPKSLRVLDLSKNLLTNECVQYLPITENDQLEELYLKWNKIQGRGGQLLFQTLVDNSSIRVLDISQNALGHPHNLCFQSLYQILFRPHEYLIHLDLSYNQFCSEDCQLIAKSIKGNQKLYGFHFSGNQEWYIDPEGWAIDRSQKPSNMKGIKILNFNDNQIDLDEINQEIRNMMVINRLEEELNTINSQHIQQKIRSIEVLGENKLQNNKYDLFDNCWICEGWQEIHFKWIPNVSGQLNEEPIYLHLDFLNYKPLPMEFYNDTFSLIKICPPNKVVRYFFTNPIQAVQLIGQDQEVQELSEDNILRSQIAKRPIFNFENSMYLRSRKMICTNIVRTTHGKLFSQAKVPQLQINSLPRGTFRQQDLISQKKKLNDQWNQQTSIFENFIGDTELQMNKCFEHDYDVSRILNLCQNQEQSDVVKETLRPFYQQIFTTYKYYASQSLNKNTPCVSLSQVSELISKTKILQAPLRPTDIQVLFISACSKDNSDISNKRMYLVEKCVVRHQFMEFLVRLAFDKYGKKGLMIQDCISNMFHDDKLLEWCQKFDVQQQWRNIRYWNLQCNDLLTNFMPTIQQIYLYATTLNIKSYTHRNKLIQYQDFYDLCHKAGVMIGISEREIMNIYILSIQTQIDEISNINHFMMSLVEFMEALARLAEKLSPCIEENMSIRQRRLQPLSRKLQILLWILCHQLKAEIKTLYFRRGLRFKDQEEILIQSLMRQEIKKIILLVENHEGDQKIEKSIEKNDEIVEFGRLKKDSVTKIELENKVEQDKIVKLNKTVELGQNIQNETAPEKQLSSRLIEYKQSKQRGQVISLDRVKNMFTRQRKSTSKGIPVKNNHTFELKLLIGMNDELPKLRGQSKTQFKTPQLIQVQYEVMKCLNFFVQNK